MSRGKGFDSGILKTVHIYTVKGKDQKGIQNNQHQLPFINMSFVPDFGQSLQIFYFILIITVKQLKLRGVK